MSIRWLDILERVALHEGFTPGGYRALCSEYVHHDPPTNYDIERVVTAIDVVTSQEGGVEVYNRRAVGGRHPGRQRTNSEGLVLNLSHEIEDDDQQHRESDHDPA